MYNSRRNLLVDSNAGVADIFIYPPDHQADRGLNAGGLWDYSHQRKVLCAATAIGTLSACAAPSSYMGIEFAPVAAASSGQSEIQSLVRGAQSGDKQAQLELGVRFEEGRGVVRDLEKAKILYQLAAQDTPIKQTNFIPEGGIIRAETTYAGVQKGLLEARFGLKLLIALLELEGN